MKKSKLKKPDFYWMMEDKDGVLYGLALGSRKDVLYNWNTFEHERYWYDHCGVFHEVKATPVCLKRVVVKRRKKK